MIASMHKKEVVIAPLLTAQLGVEIIVPQDFDSDRFGTFTREIKRAGNQLEAARAKALAAMTSVGVDLGVASEGSFGVHPSLPFVASGLELVLLLDQKNGYEVCGYSRGQETNFGSQYVKSVDQALAFARKIGFPEHGLILRKSENDNSEIYKEIVTEADLVQKVETMLGRLFTKRVFLETDMRAHRNPTRMAGIKKATEDLLTNLQSLCPQCQTPGFVVVDTERDLPCAQCGRPTELPHTDLYQCQVCQYSEKRPVTKYGTAADSQYCQYCNP